MQEGNDPALERRGRVFLMLALLIVAVLSGRLWQLQVVHGERYERLADGNRLRRIPIPAPRGNIYDALGRPLVGNRLAFTVSVVPGGLRERKDEVVQRLSELLGVPVEDVEEGLRSGQSYPYVPIRVLRQVPPEAVVAIEEHRMELPGVLIEEEPVRDYVHGEVASHIIGYLQPISREELASFPGYRATDLIGRTGLERAFENWLRGKEGMRLVEVNALSRPIRQLGEQPPEAGLDLYLTIDVDLQRAVEQAFAEHLEVLAQDPALQVAPTSGAAIMLDPRDGAVLAAVSWPGYDPARFLSPDVSSYFQELERDRRKPLLNRFMSGQYPPGSAFKPVTAVAILESRVIGPYEEYYATGYADAGGGVRKRNWTVPLGLPAPGWVDVRHALEQSVNDYFFVLGAEAGIEAIARTSREFGLGRPTGLTLMPDERPGLIGDPEWKAASRSNRPPSERRWYTAETMDVAIGQGPVLLTPLQLATVYMGIANRGVIYRPYLVKRAVNQRGEVVFAHEPVVHAQVQAAPSTWQAIQEGLELVVHGSKGTARNALAGVPYRVAGKTGSAENPGGAAHGWFAAFAPADKPEVVVVVLVENGGGGARAAAPIARKMLDAYFRLQKEREGLDTNGQREVNMAAVSVERDQAGPGW